MELIRSHINPGVFELDLSSDEAIELAKTLIDSAHRVETRLPKTMDSYSNHGMTYHDGINAIPAKFLTRVTKK